MNPVNKLSSSKKTLILLNNLGTPEAPTTEALKPYLKEFLMDPEVIDIPYPLRWALVNLIILPTRPAKSAEAYKEVWNDRGSPLKYISEDQLSKLKQLLNNFELRFSMRYGENSIKENLEYAKSQSIEQILFFPLYPQYSTATTRSSINEFKNQLQKQNYKVDYKCIKEFCTEENFIASLSKNIKESMEKIKADHLLFSYHGIPEKMLIKNSPKKNCLAYNCCEAFKPEDNLCYRAHCFHTTNAVIKNLDLSSKETSLSFQSRLGKAKWLSPYTNDKIIELANAGVKRLAITSPAFVADCLETLEELGQEARDIFLENGGEEFILVPAVNDSEDFIEFLKERCLREFE